MESSSFREDIQLSYPPSGLPEKCFTCKLNDLEEWDDQSSVCPYSVWLLQEDGNTCLLYQPID